MRAWRATAALTSFPVAQAVPGPWTLAVRDVGGWGDPGVVTGRALELATALAGDLAALAAAGCPVVVVTEPAAVTVGEDDVLRGAFLRAHRRLLPGRPGAARDARGDRRLRAPRRTRAVLRGAVRVAPVRPDRRPRQLVPRPRGARGAGDRVRGAHRGHGRAPRVTPGTPPGATRRRCSPGRPTTPRRRTAAGSSGSGSRTRRAWRASIPPRPTRRSRPSVGRRSSPRCPPREAVDAGMDPRAIVAKAGRTRALIPGAGARPTTFRNRLAAVPRPCHHRTSPVSWTLRVRPERRTRTRHTPGALHRAPNRTSPGGGRPGGRVARRARGEWRAEGGGRRATPAPRPGAPRGPGPDRHPRRLRYQPVRRLHRPRRRPRGEELHDPRRAGGRHERHRRSRASPPATAPSTRSRTRSGRSTASSAGSAPRG